MFPEAWCNIYDMFMELENKTGYEKFTGQKGNKLVVRGQRSKVRDQKSAVGDQRSEIRSWRSEGVVE
jgi:hypothetical protein